MKPEGDPMRRALALAGPGCHAVVVGTGRHRPESGFPDLPGATRSAADVAEVLQSVCGMTADRVRLLTDPADDKDVLLAVKDAVDRAQNGIVVFYFAGHGFLDPDGELHLTTSASATWDDGIRAVEYAAIRKRLSQSPAGSVVILDCCFSGTARAARRDAHRNPYVSARPDGSFLLASSTGYAPAYAPPGAEHTLFSGALLRLLKDGEAGGPKWFTLSHVHRHLDRHLKDTDALPYGEYAGRLGDLVLAANTRYAPADEPAPGAEVASEEPGAPDSPGGPDGSVALRPYPGLRPFRADEHHLFFGREGLTRELVNRVLHQESGRPLVLVGPSGVGKSSLLRAGLVATLETQTLAPVSRVLLVPAPGARPFHTLATTWADAVGQPLETVEEDLRAGRFSPPVHGHQAPGTLVIDQLEEIITQCEDAEERGLFISALTGGPAPDGPAPDAADGTQPGPAGGTQPAPVDGEPAPRAPRLVLGLRGDYHNRFVSDTQLARLIADGQINMSPMRDYELRSAIERPAEQAGLLLERGLVDLLIHDLKEKNVGGPDGGIALPFLAHALQETWARLRGGTLLTFAQYQATGGINNSVQHAADQVFASLTPGQQQELRALLLGLVWLVDDEGRAVRRRIGMEELGAHRPGHVADLLARLVEARLVVVDDNDQAQLAHDSLLYGWKQLGEWIRENREGLLALRRVAQAADTWQEAKRPASGLYSGRQLESAKALMTEGGSVLPVRPVDRDFLAASGRAQQRRKRWVVSGIAVLTSLTLVAGTLALVATSALNDAQRQATNLLARQLAAQADVMRSRDPQTALQLSLAAYHTAELPETRSSLYASYRTLSPVDLVGPQRAFLNVAFSSDGKVLATSQQGGLVQLWDVTRPTAPRKAERITVDDNAPIAFQPRSHLLAVQTKTRLFVWDVRDPRRPRKLSAVSSGGSNQAFALAFSPDGRTLASGGQKGRLRLWDMSSPAHPALRAERKVTAEAELISLAFDREGRWLATGHGVEGPDGERPAEVDLWDVRNPAEPVRLDSAPATSVMAVAFHPRSDVLVAAGGKGASAGWTVGADGKLTPLRNESDPDGPDPDAASQWEGVNADAPSLSFRPDGEAIAIADNDIHGQTVLHPFDKRGQELFDLSSLAFLPSAEAVQAVAYAPSGAYVAAGDALGHVRLWPQRAPAPSVPGALSAAIPGTSSISDDGSLMITVEVPGTSANITRIWDVSRGTKPKLRFAVPRSWEANYFLPGRDDPVLVGYHRTQGTDRHLFRLWTFVPGKKTPVPSKEITLTASFVVPSVSNDGKLLAIGNPSAQRVELWDISDTRRPRRAGTIPAAVDWGTESRFFLGDRTAATEDGYDLKIWDLTDPDRPVQAATLDDTAWHNATYSPSLHVLMSEAPGQSARLWDLKDVHHPVRGTRLPGNPGGYHDVGDRLTATSLADGTVQFWDVSDVHHPKEREDRALRFDRQITSMAVTSDGAWVVTGAPTRIVARDRSGRWETPATATLEGVSGVEILPKSRTLVIQGSGSDTKDDPGGPASLKDYSAPLYLVPLDTDQIYEDLCQKYPASIDKSQWKALFPGIDRPDSCP